MRGKKENMNRYLKYNNLLNKINNYLYDSLLSINLNLLYHLGSMLGICLIIQIISGIFLTFYYIPNINLAFDSVEYIMRQVNLGWLIRYIHANGASIFFICVYIHILRALWYNSYIGNKKDTWIIGIIIFLIMIIIAFCGYCLPYGQMSLWGSVVITSMLSAIPIYGENIVELIWGGFSVNNATLTRLFSLHFVLPFVLVGLVLTHLITLHSSGGSNPLRSW